MTSAMSVANGVITLTIAGAEEVVAAVEDAGKNSSWLPFVLFTILQIYCTGVSQLLAVYRNLVIYLYLTNIALTILCNLFLIS